MIDPQQATSTKPEGKRGKTYMGSNNSLAERPYPSTNLAAEASPLDQEDRHSVVQSSDKGRADRRKPPEQRDEDPHLQVR